MILQYYYCRSGARVQQAVSAWLSTSAWAARSVGAIASGTSARGGGSRGFALRRVRLHLRLASVPLMSRGPELLLPFDNKDCTVLVKNQFPYLLSSYSLLFVSLGSLQSARARPYAHASVSQRPRGDPGAEPFRAAPRILPPVRRARRRAHRTRAPALRSQRCQSPTMSITDSLLLMLKFNTKHYLWLIEFVSYGYSYAHNRRKLLLFNVNHFRYWYRSNTELLVAGRL